MADSITIGGVGLRLVRFKERPQVYRGEIATAFDNTLMDGRDTATPQRSWEGETDWHLPAVLASLRSAMAAGPLSCSGLVLGETVTCVVEIGDVEKGPDVSSGKTDWTDINVQFPIVLRETSAAAVEPVPIAFARESGAWVPVSTYYV